METILLGLAWLSLVIIALWFNYWAEGKITIFDAVFCVTMGPIAVPAVLLSVALKALFSKEFWNTEIISKNRDEKKIA